MPEVDPTGSTNATSNAGRPILVKDFDLTTVVRLPFAPVLFKAQFERLSVGLQGDDLASQILRCQKDVMWAVNFRAVSKQSSFQVEVD